MAKDVLSLVRRPGLPFKLGAKPTSNGERIIYRDDELFDY